MLAKSISTSSKLSKVSYFDALLFTWIIPHCDDFGRMDGDASLVKAKVFPLFPCSLDDVEISLQALKTKNLLEIYQVKGGRYLKITVFDKFQTFKKDRPRVAEYPPPKRFQMESNGIQMEPISEVKLSEVNLSEDKVPTPREIACRFFSENPNDEQQAVISKLIENGMPENIARGEIQKFVDYWIELNPTGKKQRWEMQKTFEVQRRLATWFRNTASYQNKNVEKPRGMSIIS